MERVPHLLCLRNNGQLLAKFLLLLLETSRSRQSVKSDYCFGGSAIRPFREFKRNKTPSQDQAYLGTGARSGHLSPCPGASCGR